MNIFAAIGALALMWPSILAAAADYPAPKEGDWLARDFKFHTGEMTPELKLHYTTVGDPAGTPVVVLHGTGGSAASVLTPAFAGELFGPGQPLDAAEYYIIIPDALGHGKSSKPSDGLKTKFPQYDDPDYNNGNYTTQPRFLKIASIFYGIATAGGTLNYQKQAPTREAADKLVDARLAAPITADANDFLWQWGSSADYDAAPELEKIQAWVLAINAADDERDPPETGLVERAMKQVKNAKLYLIPASEQTSGHFTTGNANFYQQQLQELLKTAPRRVM